MVPSGDPALLRIALSFAAHLKLVDESELLGEAMRARPLRHVVTGVHEAVSADNPHWLVLFAVLVARVRPPAFFAEADRPALGQLRHAGRPGAGATGVALVVVIVAHRLF